jgi:hypothetical protein
MPIRNTIPSLIPARAGERLVAHFKNWKIFHADYCRPHRTYFNAFDAARGLFFFSIT